MSLQIFASNLHTQLLSLHHVTLIAHQVPDGDAFGSLEGMRGLLKNNYPHLTVEVVVPEESLDHHIEWILGPTVTTISPQTGLILLLDTALLSRTKLPLEAFADKNIISIDHHESFTEAIDGYQDNTAASNTIILTEMADILGWTIDADTATALLMGIYTDTGGFIHRNTDARALSIAAKLMQIGANQSMIAQRVFGSYSLQYLHQLASGLQGIQVVDNIAILCLPPDIEGGLKSHIIGYLSGLENVDIACVLVPEGDTIKGSLRTRYDTVDVNQMAQKFGGGGHKKAAGFRVPGFIQGDQITLNNAHYSQADFARSLRNFSL